MFGRHQVKAVFCTLHQQHPKAAEWVIKLGEGRQTLFSVEKVEQGMTWQENLSQVEHNVMQKSLEKNQAQDSDPTRLLNLIKHNSEDSCVLDSLWEKTDGHERGRPVHQCVLPWPCVLLCGHSHSFWFQVLTTSKWAENVGRFLLTRDSESVLTWRLPGPASGAGAGAPC